MTVLRTAVSRARVAARPRARLATLIPRGPRPTQAAAWDDLSVDNSPLTGGTLHEVAERHSGRLLHKWRHYLDVYERELTPYRGGLRSADGSSRPLRFLEIGVSEGGSQYFWRDWLGPEAVVFGVDVDPSCADVVDPSVGTVRIGSQADPDFLRGVVAEMGGLDVVLDDGSHVAEHQKASFEALWPLLSDGGLYLVEDVHTSYWREFGGGLRATGSAVEEAKDLVDDLHRWYYRKDGTEDPLAPDRTDVFSVRFYDSVVAVEKRRHDPPRRFTRGDEVRGASGDPGPDDDRR